MINLVTAGTTIYFKPKDDNMGLTFNMINDISNLGSEDGEFSGYYLHLSDDREHGNWYKFEQISESLSVDKINVIVSKIREICKGVDLIFSAHTVEWKYVDSMGCEFPTIQPVDELLLYSINK